MDRTGLKLPFTLTRQADWLCPRCQMGLLRIKKGSFVKEEAKDSRDHTHEAWEPDWIRYVFSCMLVCTSDQCKEVVSCSGAGSVDFDLFEDENGEIKQEYEDTFRPKYFEPHLIFINIPEKCPKAIAEPLKESFRLFFASPSAASNNVRIALEELLTDLNVKRFNRVNGKLRFVNLHQRIDLLPTKYAQLKDMIFAVKWLGNAGSHSHDGKQGISMDDVMDSYELMEHILAEIYAPKTRKLASLAKRVIKKKGPVKRTKGRT